jgi:8-oxo-dGTP pyrophosphatase MutT (NUDIX family)
MLKMLELEPTGEIAIRSIVRLLAGFGQAPNLGDTWRMGPARIPTAPEELIAFLRERLSKREPLQVEAPGVRRAAVLLPLLFKANEPYVLFTQRSLEVPTHKGHISFPGGVQESDDADAATAALRETEEEIGIPPEQIGLLGRLDDHLTNTSDFLITPFVALVPDGAAHITSDQEVARILEAPLEFLLDPAHREPDARTRHWQYRWQDVVIWGATARILNEFLSILGLTNPSADDSLILEARPIEPT